MQEHPISGTHRLLLVLLGTLAVALAWLLTPRYGPWPCHGIAAPVSLIGALILWPSGAQVARPGLGLLGALLLGVLLAGASWYLAPFASAKIPALGKELHQLYTTLNRAPGPVKAVPILCLSVLAEELVWRGALVDWLLSRKLSTLHLTIVATACYTLPIVSSRSWLLVTVAVTLGSALTVQRLYLRSWLPCFVTHLTWNLLVFVAHPLV